MPPITCTWTHPFSGSGSRIWGSSLLAPVELSAVCFRYRGTDSDPDLNRLNAAILRRIIENGRVYLSNASIAGTFALRACFVNHRSRSSDVAEIVPEVLKAARSIGMHGQ